MKVWPVIVFLGGSDIDEERMRLYQARRWGGGVIMKLKVVLSKRFKSVDSSTCHHSFHLLLHPFFAFCLYLSLSPDRALVSINPSFSRKKKMSRFIAFYNALMYASFCGITVPSMMSSNYQWFNGQIPESLKFNTRLSWAGLPLQVCSLLSWSSTDHLTEHWVQILLAEWWLP